MKVIYDVALHIDSLGLPDDQLGEKVRKKLIEAQAAHVAAIAAGKRKSRDKNGWPITIDGVRYPSRADAREALGLTIKQFSRLFSTDDSMHEPVYTTERKTI